MVVGVAGQQKTGLLAECGLCEMVACVAAAVVVLFQVLLVVVVDFLVVVARL